jgi:hypothetical protein
VKCSSVAEFGNSRGSPSGQLNTAENGRNRTTLGDKIGENSLFLLKEMK